METFHATTILGVRRGKSVCLAGDGQVTFANTMVMKHNAHKVRRLYHDKVLAGFAGAVADAFTLFDLFEKELESQDGMLARAAVNLTKKWRMDRQLGRLEAMLLVADTKNLLLLSGTGEVIEPDDGVVAIGSGGPYALSAARALLRHTDLPARAIAEGAMQIAGEICVYTNDHLVVEELSE